MADSCITDRTIMPLLIYWGICRVI